MKAAPKTFSDALEQVNNLTAEVELAFAKSMNSIQQVLDEWEFQEGDAPVHVDALKKRMHLVRMLNAASTMIERGIKFHCDQEEAQALSKVQLDITTIALKINNLITHGERQEQSPTQETQQ